MSILWIIYYILPPSFFLLVPSVFYVRRFLVRRVQRVENLEPIYGDPAIVPGVLHTSRRPDDYCFDLRLEGKAWELDFKSKGGLRRAFVWTHAYYVAEEVFLRIKRAPRSPFLVAHALGFLVLWAVVAAKSILLPSTYDLWMLIGYDMIAAQRVGPRLVPQHEASESVR